MHYLSPGFYCNDSSISTDYSIPLTGKDLHQDEQYTILGEPTETSIISLGIAVCGRSLIEKIHRNLPIEKIPFEAASKFMATMHELNLIELSEAIGPLELPSNMINGVLISFIQRSLIHSTRRWES